MREEINLILYQYHIFPRFAPVIIKRSSKYGGNREFRDYAELEAAYNNDEVHPLDIKKSASTYLCEMLQGVREFLK
jgi:tyrosyl-tRNA synthetase